MTTWSQWHPNPFTAISEIAKPGDFGKALLQLQHSAFCWDAWDPESYVDDLLAEIAGATNIVVQIESPSLFEQKLYRAAYDQ